MSPDDKRTHTERNWRGLAEQASKESDPEKLLSLIKELCDALDHRTPGPTPGKPVNKKSDVVG